MECHLCAEVVLCVAWSVSVGEVMILIAASGQTERKLMQCDGTRTVLSVVSDYGLDNMYLLCLPGPNEFKLRWWHLCFASLSARVCQNQSQMDPDSGHRL